MKSLSLLAALLLTGPVIKATPPLPPRVVTPSSYSNFETTLIEKYDDEESVSGKGKSYKIHVKNTGYGYINYVYFTFDGGFQSYSSKIEDYCSDAYVIAPNQEADFIVSANYDTDKLDDFTIAADAYTDFTDEVYVYGNHTITSVRNDLTSDENYRYHNIVDVDFDVYYSRYCYGAIIKVNNEGEYSYFVVQFTDNYFAFDSKYPLTMEGEHKGIQVVKVLKKEYSHYKVEKRNDTIQTLLSVVIPSTVLFLIIGIVFFVVIKINQRKKKV